MEAATAYWHGGDLARAKDLLGRAESLDQVPDSSDWVVLSCAVCSRRRLVFLPMLSTTCAKSSRRPVSAPAPNSSDWCSPTGSVPRGSRHCCRLGPPSRHLVTAVCAATVPTV